MLHIWTSWKHPIQGALVEGKDWNEIKIGRRKHPILGALVEGSHVMSYMLPMAEEPHTECVG